MIKPIDNLNLNLLTEGLNNEKKAGTSSTSFVDLFQQSINQVNDLMVEADQVTTDFALGKIDDVHQVTIATEKAQVALNLTLAIQNKVVEAYNEIMRLQI